MSNFLPTGYTPPATQNNYMRFEEGDNKFRVLGSAITGWEYWVDKNGDVVGRSDRAGEGGKPVRNRDLMALSNEAKREAKHFWAFPVWNYKAKRVQILELTQATIMNPINAIVSDDAWGDPKGFDITVKRTGEGLDTEYSTIPSPHKAFKENVGDIEKINLEALFGGEDPFEGYDPGEEIVDPSEVPNFDGKVEK